MKVKDLIARLQEFDGELEVGVCAWEGTNSVAQVRVETRNNHCYDKGDHIIDVEEVDKMVMIADEEYTLDENDYTIQRCECDEDED